MKLHLDGNVDGNVDGYCDGYDDGYGVYSNRALSFLCVVCVCGGEGEG